VARRLAKRGSPLGVNRDAQRGAISERRQRNAFGHGRVINSRDAAQRVDHEVALESRLRARSHVLPLAATTPVGYKATRWRDTVGGRDDQLVDLAAREITSFFGDARDNALAGHRSGNEHDASRVITTEPVAARDHCGDVEGDGVGRVVRQRRRQACGAAGDDAIRARVAAR